MPDTLAVSTRTWSHRACGSLPTPQAQEPDFHLSYESDPYRIRLTHSLEGPQIARSECQVLGLHEGFDQNAGVTHDLERPSFGHAGEQVFRICMAPYGGFDHNTQVLRVLTRREHRHAAFDGFNLTWETLEGMVKHNGPLLAAQSSGVQLGEINVWPNGMNHESLRDIFSRTRGRVWRCR